MATVTEVRSPRVRAADPSRSLRRAERWGWQVAKHATLLTFLLIFLFPFLWMWSSALRTSQEIFRDPFGLPTALHWENFREAWTIGRFDSYMGNTILYSAAIVAGVAFLSCLTGYALATLRFPGRDVIFTLFLLGLPIPFQSLMVPLFYLLRDLGLVATRWAMIVPSIALGLPFGIFLMRAFFRSLPAELADAARVDGAGEWGVFRQIMLPLSAPGLISLTVFQFMWTWKEFLLPLVLVQREELRPVALGIMFFFGRYTADRGMIAAGVTISTLPIILLYLVLQRQFIRGITAGAVKS